MSNLTYMQTGDYQIPNLTLNRQPEAEIGKYGRMRKNYLKEQKTAIYSHMLLMEELYPHLLEVDRMVQEQVKQTTARMAQVKALAAGDPDIKERMQLDTDIKRLKLLHSNYLSNKYELEDAVNKHYPAQIEQLIRINEAIRKDITLYSQHKSEDFPGMVLNGMRFTDKAQAGAALLEMCRAQTDTKKHSIGLYCGFTLLLSFDSMFKRHSISLESSHRYELELGSDVHGNIQRLDNCFKAMPETVLRNEQNISELRRQMENAAVEITKPFAHEFDLAQKQARLIELDAKLKTGEHFNEAAALDEPEESMEREKIAMER